MNDDRRHGICCRHGLIAEERSEATALVEFCNRHEGLELPVNLSEPEALREGDADQLLFFENGVLVGLLSADFLSEVEVCLAVHPEQRRRGVGRALLAAARERCRERGAASCLLVTDEASRSGPAYAVAMGAVYRDAEHRMELDVERFLQSRGGATVMTLQPVWEENVEAFARIRAAVYGGSVEAMHQRVVWDLQRPKHQTYLARVEDEPVGTVRVGPLDGRVFITALAVHPEYRGRGYGRQILTQTIDRLLTADLKQISIEVNSENRVALSLYRSCGFRETRTYGYYAMTV
jgi:ribosomal protein S18 acetylase RimI-like enzyme